VTTDRPALRAKQHGGGCAAAGFVVPAKGYRAAPQASRVLRIALRATHLRCALDPRASAAPQAGNAGRPSLPHRRRGHHKTSKPFNITATEVSTVRGD
jgi:hypothetical protein